MYKSYLGLEQDLQIHVISKSTGLFLCLIFLPVALEREPLNLFCGPESHFAGFTPP